GDDMTAENVKDDGLRLSGEIQENEKADKVQVSHFSGRIEKLNVNFVGEKVNKGQLLATIYSPELVATQQELLTTATLKESQPELYQAVRNKLKLWKLSESQINQIEHSGMIKDNFSVFTQVSGTVSEMMVQQGDYVNRGQGLFKIDNLNSLWAIFDVYESQIAEIKIGQPIKITTNAYPDKVFNGSVSFIYPTLDEKTRTIKVRANINNNGKLKPGMFIEGVIKNATKGATTTLSIPASSVLWTGKRSVVYVKTSPNEPIFEMREVEIGKQTGETYRILSGLKYSEEIVTNGAFTVDAAAQLQGKKSMMNKADRKTTTEHEGHLDMNSEVWNKKIEVSNEFKKQLKFVFVDYHKLKDELVNSNAEKVQTNAKAMLISLSNIDRQLLKDNNAHKQWMVLEKEIKKQTERIGKTNDLEKQRQYFKPLSNHFIRGVQMFGINQTVYQQYCPMADSNKGAYWLSTEKQIRNPYFGDKMLKCGKVEAEFK
ncbi:MAG: efflux RND transporter periplasmic adaptor subunit, partial [Flavobacteriales bacterium]